MYWSKPFKKVLESATYFIRFNDRKTQTQQYTKDFMISLCMYVLKNLSRFGISYARAVSGLIDANFELVKDGEILIFLIKASLRFKIFIFSVFTTSSSQRLIYYLKI